MLGHPHNQSIRGSFQTLLNMAKSLCFAIIFTVQSWLLLSIVLNYSAPKQLSSARLPLSAAVCVVAKDDEAYIDEWVDYHQALGFSQFFVYDNSESNWMKQWGDEKGDHITVIHYPDEMKRNFMFEATEDCARRVAYEGMHKWVAFFDIREFLILKKHGEVIRFLEKFCPSGGVSINRLLFGTAGRNVYSPQPVTKRFVYCKPEADKRVNQIFYVEDMIKSSSQITVKDTGGRVVGLGSVSANAHKPTDVAVFHYYLRSAKEYKHKMGKALHIDENRTAEEPQEYELFNGTKQDETAWEALKRLVPRYSMYDLHLAGNESLWPRYPPQHSTNATAAICVLAKYEEAYIDEWVDYHRAIGFTNFYIYDNSPNHELEQWASEKGNDVMSKHFPGFGVQSLSFKACLDEFILPRNHTWVAFTDVDEMIILKKHNNILDLLHDHCASGSLGLRWTTYGAGKRDVYQPLPVTRRFLYRKQASAFIKSIARVRDMDHQRNPEPHNIFLKHGTQHFTNGTAFTGSIHPDAPTDVAYISHYFTKSFKEFVAKRMRGEGRYGKDGIDAKVTDAMQRKTGIDDLIYDEESWETTKHYLPHYRMFDQM